MNMEHHHHPHPAPSGSVAETTTDPICGMTVKVGTAKGGSATHDGHDYWFCSTGCRTKFVADPGRYVGPRTPPAEEAPGDPGAIYTCPMHPEIRQQGPRACPICGMALE